MLTEVAWQKGNEPEAARVQTLSLSQASPALAPPIVANPPSATPATTLQRDPGPEANGIQPSGAASANSGGSGPYADLSDTSPSGQGKSGQQNGASSGDNPAGVTTFAAPSIANNLAADSTVNLLAAHAPSIPASPANPSAPPTPPSSPQAPATLSAWQNYDGGTGSIVRSASLNGFANGAEMHVEFRAGTLGPLEVHAVVNAGSVGAEIHVQGQEAHTLLAAGLPALERALGERNLRVDNLAVYQDHSGGAMSGGEKQNQQSGSYSSAQHQVMPWNSPPQSNGAAGGSLEDDELANPAAGLSVQA
jgi:hypothetical protein